MVETESVEKQFKLTVLKYGLSETDSYILNEYEMYEFEIAMEYKGFFEFELGGKQIRLNTAFLVSVEIEEV